MKRSLVVLLMGSMLCACLAGCGHKAKNEEFVMNEGKMKQTETTADVSDEEDSFEEAVEEESIDEAADDENATDMAEDSESGAFSVTITEVGPNKVKVIKAVREVTGLGLKEAKDLVDAASEAPVLIAEGITEEEANEIKTKLEAEEATVTVEE